MVCPNKKGYTLIELIMVMIIAGIISVVFVTRLIGTTSLNQEIGLSIIRDHIRYASDYAMASGIKTVVYFDVLNNTYSLFKEDLSGRTPIENPEDMQNFVVDLNDPRFKGLNLTGININGTDEIKFFSYGVPSDANDVKLSAQAFVEINGSSAITIYPVSGFCKVIP